MKDSRAETPRSKDLPPSGTSPLPAAIGKLDSRDEWLLVEPLFDRALDLDDRRRAEFVGRVRRRSAGIAEKLVQLLDAAEGATEVIIDRSLADVASDLVSELPIERTAGLAIGSMVGRYRLLQALGSGGMGQVFRAQAAGEDQVALKVLISREQGLVSVRRFEREQRILCQLDHPCVAPVFDFGQSEQGFPYFALRLVEGQPITDFCRQLDLDLQQRVGLLRTVCSAVEAAHIGGVIHRDLKPSNILVEGERSSPMPFVLDFGIARDSKPMELTASGQILGTPGYMSPEQARGDSRKVSARSDIFSLGVLAYELLSGQGPFRRQSAVETLTAVIRDPVEPLHQVCTGIDHSLSEAVQRCLEKDPAKRYHSVAELLLALQ